MMTIGTIVLIVCVALILSALLTPCMRHIAITTGVYDRPTDRKVHATPTPLLGGIALFLGVIIALAVGAWRYDAVLLSMGHTWPWLFAASVVLVLGGVLDDMFHWPAWLKLAGQVCSIAVVCWGGIHVRVVTNPLQGTELTLPPWVSIAVTMVWLLAVINAVNLLDGLDGLAAGMMAIIACFLMYISLRLDNTFVVYILAAVTGSCVGFLRYNWPPAKIFMGDTGSQFLGFAIGVAPLVGFQYKAATAVALMVPLTMLAIPLSDVGLAIVRRLQGRRSIFRADKQHLHHRLLALGLSQRQVVLFMYGVSAYLGLIAILFVLIPQQHAVVLMLLLGLGMFMGIRTIGFIERRLRYLYLQEKKRR